MSRAAALAAVMLWLGSAPDAQAEQQLAVYPGVVHTRIGDDLVIGNELYRLAYFTTLDPLVKVARFFEKQWRDQGYPTVVAGDLKQEAVVSALYTREGLQRGIVLRRHEGKTLGFTVLRDLWLRPTPATSSAGLTRLEGALYSGDVRSRDADGASQHRTSVIAGGLEAVRQEIEQQLGSAGFERVRTTQQKVDGKRQLTLEFASPQRQVVTSLTEVEHGLTSVVQLSVASDRVDGVSNDAAVRRRKASAVQPREGAQP